jgi:hypothetical protein
MFNDQELDLTADERAALAALPRKHAPSDLLEERITRELRTRGFFAGRRQGGGRVARLALRAAAAAAIFGAGVATDRFLTERNRPDELPPSRATQVRAERPIPTQMELWI